MAIFRDRPQAFAVAGGFRSRGRVHEETDNREGPREAARARDGVVHNMHLSLDQGEYLTPVLQTATGCCSESPPKKLMETYTLTHGYCYRQYEGGEAKLREGVAHGQMRHI